MRKTITSRCASSATWTTWWRARWPCCLARSGAAASSCGSTALSSFGGRKPRAVVATVAPSPQVMELQAEHERLMQRVGLEPEGRKFTPHVTLARLRDASSQRRCRISLDARRLPLRAVQGVALRAVLVARLGRRRALRGRGGLSAHARSGTMGAGLASGGAVRPGMHREFITLEVETARCWRLRESRDDALRALGQVRHSARNRQWWSSRRCAGRWPTSQPQRRFEPPRNQQGTAQAGWSSLSRHRRAGIERPATLCTSRVSANSTGSEHPQPNTGAPHAQHHPHDDLSGAGRAGHARLPSL